MLHTDEPPPHMDQIQDSGSHEYCDSGEGRRERERERERVWHSLKILKYSILLSCLGQHTHALVKHLDLDGICAAVQQMNLQKYTIMIMQAMTGIAP